MGGLALHETRRLQSVDRCHKSDDAADLLHLGDLLDHLLECDRRDWPAFGLVLRRLLTAVVNKGNFFSRDDMPSQLIGSFKGV